MAKKALEVDERCDIAYAHLAQIYLQQENQQGAIESYEKGMHRARLADVEGATGPVRVR